MDLVGIESVPKKSNLFNEKRTTYENCQINHSPSYRPEGQRSQRAFLGEAEFRCGICDLGVPLGDREPFRGRTTGLHHDAARGFRSYDLRTRISERFDRSESDGADPDH